MPNNSKFSNHLTGEKSPYLLQHAHNPVDWYPWTDAAFQKAKLEDKPVLLSVGYSTCHWCHVMAHESFEDEAIAKIINEHFVAIKVDREERPDIDHIYMTATTSMTGQGGWPLTVFLTAQGEPFYGGTYFPPYAKWGSPGFIDLLESIAKAWGSDRGNILSSSRSITEALRRHAESRVIVSPSSGVIASEAKQSFMDETLPDKAFRQMRGQFDGANGGFGTSPKFPMGHQLSFLLRYYKRCNEPEALSMVNKTLTAMANGGIWDHLGGGFHRYSTDQNWHVPHFEKMLYDQALLARAYLEAYQVALSTDRHSDSIDCHSDSIDCHSEVEDRRILIEYEQTARGILDYVLREMTEAQGGFYSAQDADSLEVPAHSGAVPAHSGAVPAHSGAGAHLKEGAFYVFSQPEIEEILGLQKAGIFNYCYGVLPQGNASFDPHGEFKGKNIFYWAHSIHEAAEKFQTNENKIQEILAESTSKLLALRIQRPRPHLDDKVLCDWNGLMISSFAFASRVLDEPKYIKAASKAADFILGHLMQGSRLLHRWREGAGIPAMLEDYAFFIYGLLELYEAGFDEKYLEAAQKLADGMIEFFGDPSGPAHSGAGPAHSGAGPAHSGAGGFYMTASDAEPLIIRPKEVYDGALPSGNSVAALVLLKLYALTQKEIYNSHAQALFNYFAGSVAQSPYAHSFLLSAFDWYLQGPLEISLVGPRDDTTVAKMIKVLYKNFIPSKAVKLIAAKPAAGQALNGGRAQICFRGVCKAPIDSIEVFESVIANEVKQSFTKE